LYHRKTNIYHSIPLLHINATATPLLTYTTTSISHVTSVHTTHHVHVNPFLHATLHNILTTSNASSLTAPLNVIPPAVTLIVPEFENAPLSVAVPLPLFVNVPLASTLIGGPIVTLVVGVSANVVPLGTDIPTHPPDTPSTNVIVTVPLVVKQVAKVTCHHNSMQIHNQRTFLPSAISRK